jgi:hypothetical protein
MDDQRTRLRALCERAVGGTWGVDELDPYLIVTDDPSGSVTEHVAQVVCPMDDEGDPYEANAALIVGAVNALPAMLDALDAAERERDTAREDLARIGRLVGCDSLVGVEIHAAVEHVVRHELDAARDAAERAERERADALAEVETLRAEAALMREIIEGRTTPPTRESFIALGATDGTVRYHRPDGGHGWFPASDPWWGAVVSLCREGARLWAHDANGRPCAWPTVTP